MYELRVVRERRHGYGRRRRIREARDIFEAFKDHFAPLDREQFVVVLLDGKNNVLTHRVLGFNVVSTGTLTAALVHPREVFVAAILQNAAAIVLLHNHPSGDPEPSAEDRAITERLKQAGELLGIKILDHVIIGDGGFRSFADDHLL
jgi:DNA repair protein RadC